MTIAYEKMGAPTSTPSKVSIINRIQNVDYRVWFFTFVVGNIAFDLKSIDYILQYGVEKHTFDIPCFFILHGFFLYAAVTNNVIAMKMVKLFTIVILFMNRIAAVVLPVWMIYGFHSGAPEVIRTILEHGENYIMSFDQKLAYCVYYELTVIFYVACSAIELFLAQEILQVIKKEKMEMSVEMGSLGINV